MIEIDAAIGGPYDYIKEIIDRKGLEDSSGFRRHIVYMMAQNKMEKVASMLDISLSEANDLKQKFIDAWGAPPLDIVSED